MYKTFQRDSAFSTLCFLKLWYKTNCIDVMNQSLKDLNVLSVTMSHFVKI